MQALIQPEQLVMTDSPKLSLRHAPSWVEPTTATLWLEQLQEEVQHSLPLKKHLAHQLHELP